MQKGNELKNNTSFGAKAAGVAAISALLLGAGMGAANANEEPVVGGTDPAVTEPAPAPGPGEADYNNDYTPPPEQYDGSPDPEVTPPPAEEEVAPEPEEEPKNGKALGKSKGKGNPWNPDRTVNTDKETKVEGEKNNNSHRSTDKSFRTAK